MKKYSLEEAIEKRRVVSFSSGPKLVFKELKEAKEDLKDARDLLLKKRFKSATTLSYYAVFHTARALLYKKRYREKSHIQLAFAIKALYVDKGVLPEEYYDNFIQALNLREMADYKRKHSKDGADRNVLIAEEAIKLTEKILSR